MSNETTVIENIDTLIVKINSEYQQFEDVSKRGLLHLRNVGEGLLKARELCKHGQWLQWLSTNCPAIAERTAQAAMQISRSWKVIEVKSASVADLTINEALKLIPPKLPEMNARYAGWYDYSADAVWRTKGNAQAFRDAITIPDIMDKLTTDQIVPLAQAIFKDLTLHSDLSGENEFTTYRITAEVKRRFKEAFAKNAEEKYKERLLEEPHNKLVRELRDGEIAMRKANSSIRNIEYLACKHPELKTANTGIMQPNFNMAALELKETLLNGVESIKEKEVIDSNKPPMLEDKSSLVLKTYALWQQMNEFEREEFLKLQSKDIKLAA